jgi:hypothetical protein
MLFVKRADQEPYFDATTSGVIRFLPSTYDHAHLSGVLRLAKELSLSCSDGNWSQDLTLPEIALPVPLVTKNAHDKLKVLPGAPRAFADQRLEVYHD